MIQPLPTRRNVWTLFWVELDQPVPGKEGYFLPTLLVLCDARGVPLASPEILPELEQERAEDLLEKVMQEQGKPEQVVVAASQDWVADDWKTFSTEMEVPVRLDKEIKKGLVSVVEMARTELQGDASEAGETSPAEIATGLVQVAQTLQSTRRRGDYLRKALELDAGSSEAAIELADLEFQNGHWKTCLARYEAIRRRELEKWRVNSPGEWWENRATRPALRALYGAGMAWWHQGNYIEAVRTFQELIGINRRDHQGVRFFIPHLWLLADQIEEAAHFFEHYEREYVGDFAEPSFLFAWGFTLHACGEEQKAREKYRAGILKNIYIAPMLLDLDEPTGQLWFPTDRSQPNYAGEFLDSYAPLWDRDSGAARPVREVWEECAERVREIVRHRRRMLDFQDQRYDPKFREKWQVLVEEEERLTTP